MVVDVTNTGTEAIPLQDLVLRYYFSTEPPIPGFGAWCDWAAIGSDKVTLSVEELNPPFIGATHSLRVGFLPAAGQLAPGSSTGEIQLRLSKSDWSSFDQSNDYSFGGSGEFLEWEKITVHLGSQLVWGKEPADPLPPPPGLAESLSVLYANGEPALTTQGLRPKFRLRNSGAQAVSYERLRIRYWFTREGTSQVVAWKDYFGSPLDGATVDVLEMNSPESGASHFAELSFPSTAGQLAAWSESPELQLRLSKADWSSFSQDNDYSFLDTQSYAENPHVALYLDGVLIAGQAPGDSTPKHAGINLVGGNNQIGLPGTFLSQPLAVEFRDANDVPLANASVVFTAQNGGLAEQGGSQTTTTTLNVITGVDGIARAYFKQGAEPAATNTVTAQSGTSEIVTFTSRTTLADGLWSEWKLDEGSGTTASDCTGLTVNGLLINQPQWSPGFDGRGGLTFSGSQSEGGSNAHVTFGNPSDGSLDFGSDSFSIALWVKYTDVSIPSGQSDRRIISKGHHGFNTGYTLALEGTGQLYTGIGSTQGTASQALFFHTVAEYNDGKWHHVAAVFDRQNSTARIYVDGVAQALACGANTGGAVDSQDSTVINYPALSTLSATRADTPLTVSSYMGTSDFFKGDVDDVRFYRKAITAQEVQSLYNADSDGIGGVGDGLPDWWEWENFGRLGIDPGADPDGDGLTNLQEYQQSSDPNDFFNGHLPDLRVVGGDGQSGPAGQILPTALTVEVSDSNGGLANAPVTFEVLEGGGQIASGSSGEGLAASLEVRAGTSDGRASVFLSPTGSAGTGVQVRASVTTSGQTRSVIFNATVVASYRKPEIRFSTGYALYSINLTEAASFPVTISDPDNRTVKVELYAGGTKVAESTTPPFTTEWTPSQAGRVPIVVRLVDADGKYSVDGRMLQVLAPNIDTVAYSPASGGMSVVFPAGTDTISSLPFYEAAVYAGRMEGVNGNEITAESGVSWQPDHFAPADVSYELQILSGPLEGAEFPILGNTASTVQVNGLDSGALPDPGTEFLIRPRWTVSGAVPESLFNVGDGTAPELKLPDLTGEGTDRPYAKTLLWTSGGWQEEGGSTGSSPILLPKSWFVVRNNSTLPTMWMPIGDVSHASVKLSIGKELAGPQDTPLTLPRPGVFSPMVAGVMSGDVLQESPDLGHPGDVLIGYSARSGPIGRTPDLTLYRHDGQLVQLGNETGAGDLSGQDILDGGTGWIIRRSGPATDLFNHAEHAIP
jgi:uncharacterized protein (TIGR02597 family)